MIKTLAVLRTGFLLFLLGNAAIIWMRSFGMLTDCDLNLKRAVRVTNSLTWALAFAVGWIAFETLVGWLMASRASRKAAKAKAEAALTA